MAKCPWTLRYVVAGRRLARDGVVVPRSSDLSDCLRGGRVSRPHRGSLISQRAGVWSNHQLVNEREREAQPGAGPVLSFHVSVLSSAKLGKADRERSELRVRTVYCV